MRVALGSKRTDYKKILEIFFHFARHSTLWQLIQEKQIKFPEEATEIIVNDATENGDVQDSNEDDVDKDKIIKEDKLKQSLSVHDVVNQMVVLFPKSKNDINTKLKNVINVLKDDVNAIERVAREITEDASNNGVKYFEVGLDPTKFVSSCDDDLSYTNVVQAALDGLKAGSKDFTGTKAGVILQCERGKTQELKGLLTICDKLKNEGVVGVELTCNEEVINTEIAGEGGSVESLLFSSEDISFMAEAKEKKIRRSVQAGEFGPPDMVFQALEKLQAERIVFGYSSIQVNITKFHEIHSSFHHQDPSLYHDLKTNKIHLVTSPSMSILTSSVPVSNFYHPIVQVSFKIIR